MGPWAQVTRIVVAVITVPATILIIDRLPWKLTLTPVLGAVLIGAMLGFFGTAAENAVHGYLTPPARFLFWGGMAALLLWAAATYTPGFHLGTTAGLTASAIVGLVEALLPAGVMEH